MLQKLIDLLGICTIIQWIKDIEDLQKCSILSFLAMELNVENNISALLTEIMPLSRVFQCMKMQYLLVAR